MNIRDCQMNKAPIFTNICFFIPRKKKIIERMEAKKAHGNHVPFFFVPSLLYYSITNFFVPA
jgi:hypothetical protein